MIAFFKLKTRVGYKCINLSHVKYFEPYENDRSKTLVLFSDRERDDLILHVDFEILIKEIAEYIEPDVELDQKKERRVLS